MENTGEVNRHPGKIKPFLEVSDQIAGEDEPAFRFYP
jgi:hypothetical protein